MIKMNILLLGPMEDMQTGIYLMYAFNRIGTNVKAIDTRAMLNHVDAYQFKPALLSEMDRLSFTPDLIIVLKGLEIDKEVLDNIKELYPDAKLANWFFDKYLESKPIWESGNYMDVLDSYDYFFCSLKGVADKLKALGHDNVHYMPEACDEYFHAPQYLNPYQEDKYGSDVAFIGSLGFHLQHPNRIPILEKVTDEAFDLKIWGNLVGDYKKIPGDLLEAHQMTSVVNEHHSLVCNASNVVLGIDQDEDLELGFSARLYRVMCAGGVYLTNYVPGLENLFSINSREDKELTPDLDLVVYYDEESLVRNLDILLQDKELRESISRNARDAVLKEHTFDMRCKELIEVVRGDINE